MFRCDLFEYNTICERREAGEIIIKFCDVAMAPASVDQVICSVIMKHKLINGLGPVMKFIDQGFAQVGVVLAERLGATHSTIIMEVQADPAAGTLRVKRELEGGWFQWIAMPLPAVLTIQSGINQLRYATLKGIMAAKKKEIRVVPAPPAPPARQRITAVYVPEKSKQTRMIGGSPAEAAKELVRVLREEVRVV